MITYENIVPPTIQMLTNLERWLDAGVEHAKRGNWDPELLLTHRLAPDAFNLRKQVQASCDQAKFIAARLAGKEAPKHEDGEQSLEQLRARIADVKTFLKTFTKDDFVGADERVVPLGWAPGKGALGRDYALEFALPNFYFHTTTAYQILRSCGVQLGKIQFIGHVTLRDL